MLNFAAELERIMGQRRWRVGALLTLITALLLAIGISLFASPGPAQAGPGCDVKCGVVWNKSHYNIGIGVLYRAWSNYPYDAIVYVGQASNQYAPDIDKVYSGQGWCVEAWTDYGYAWTVKGPGWSGNLTDWQGPFRLYAYPCGGQVGSW